MLLPNESDGNIASIPDLDGTDNLNVSTANKDDGDADSPRTLTVDIPLSCIVSKE